MIYELLWTSFDVIDVIAQLQAILTIISGLESRVLISYLIW